MFIALALEFGIDTEPLAALLHQLQIGTGEITPCETAIVDGVQQIGLPDPVFPANTGNPATEGKAGRRVVPEPEQLYRIQAEQNGDLRMQDTRKLFPRQNQQFMQGKRF